MKRRLRGMKARVEKINNELDEVNDLQSESEALLDAADDAMISARAGFQNITNMRTSLRNSSLVLEAKEGILSGLNPLYRTKYVKPAQEHAEALKRLAMDYQK